MKKLSFQILIIVLFTISFSCSKNNNNKIPTSSEWSYHDSTFKGYATYYDSGFLPRVVSLDSQGNKIYVNFSVHPVVNSQYIVVTNVYDSFNIGHYAAIDVSQARSNYDYGSTAKVGDIVNATIIDGKVHVTFSNISISNFEGNATISGNLIQTIP